MNKLFVSYELALKLVKKGFNYPCLGFYDILADETQGVFMDNIDEEFYIDNKGYDTRCAAPLYQQVIDWLRDVKYINIETHYDYITYDVSIYNFKEGNSVKLQSSLIDGTPYCFTDIYEALNEGIKEALKLI